jgi:hypothetical protein
MEHAQLAKENERKPIEHSSTSAPKKAARVQPVRPLRKKSGSNSKSEKLVCRYCGSDDLAPSFVARRGSPMPQVL